MISAPQSGSVENNIVTASPQAMTGALQRVLASTRFEASPTMRSFLTYIVEETIAGRETDLKAYSIAIDALEKPESFDAQTDPTVRVLAGRVRTALIEYYAEDGTDDPFRITVPTGGYRPVFEANVPVAIEQEAALDSSHFESDRSETSPAVMALIIAIPTLALAALIYFFALPTAPTQQAGSISVLVSEVPRQAQSPEDAQQAALLVRELRSVLARNESLTVIASEPGDGDAPPQLDFSITGVLKRDGEGKNFSTELINSRTKAVVWARTFPLPTSDENPNPVVASIARELHTQIFGASIKALEGRDPKTLSAQQLFVLATWVPGPSKNTLAWEQERIELARLALKKDPALGAAHSVLADKLAYLSAVDGPSNTPEALTEAATKAARALELAPGDAMAVFNVAQSQWHSGRLKDAIRTMNRVVELNPNFALAEFFTNVIPYSCVSAPDDVLAAATAFDQSLGSDNPVRWVTLTWLGWLHLNRDEYEMALEAEKRAAQIFQIPYTVMRHAAVLNVLDRPDEAARLLRSQKRNWPNLDPAHFSEVTMPRLCSEYPGEEKMLGFYRDLTEAMKGRLKD